MNTLDSAVRFGALACLGLAFSIVAYGAAAAPSSAGVTVGMRGLKRARALQRGALLGNVDPFLRWLKSRIAPFVPRALERRLDQFLTRAGDPWGLGPEELLALDLCCGLLGLGAGFAVHTLSNGRSLFPLLGGVAGVVLPYLQLSARQQRREREIDQSLPYVLDLAALGLSAGLDFPGSLRQLVEKSCNAESPLVEELQYVLREIQVGKTRREALQSLAVRCPSASIGEFVATVIQAEEGGHPLGPVLKIQSQTLRQQRSVRGEEKASQANVKLVLPMALLLMAVLMLVAAPMVLELGQIFRGLAL